MKSFNLRAVRLRSGEEYRDAIELRLEPYELGGQRYLPIPEEVPAEFVMTKASTGTVFELNFRGRLHGPCFRCLEDAVVDLPVGAREYQATNPDGVEELATPYINEQSLDISQWGRDALALELPDKILCRPDCAGLCPVCGRNLNDEPHEHEDAEPDSRWAALAELRDRL